MRLVSRDASADLLQNLLRRLKSITRRGVLSRFGTTIIGASHRSWLFFAETFSSIPILTASSRSFFVFSFSASGVAITLVVRFAFIALCSSFNSTVIFGTCIIGRVWVWHTFIALALNSFLRNSCRTSDRSPPLFFISSSSSQNMSSKCFLLNGPGLVLSGHLHMTVPSGFFVHDRSQTDIFLSFSSTVFTENDLASLSDRNSFGSKMPNLIMQSLEIRDVSKSGLV